MQKYQADVCYCKMMRHNYARGESRYYPNLKEGIVPYETILSKSHASTQTILAKADVCKNIRFDTNIKRCQDFDWCIRAGETYRFVFSEDVLVDVYLQEDSITNINVEKTLESYQVLMNKYNHICNKYPEFRIRLLRTIGAQRTNIGDRSGDEFRQIYKLTDNKKMIMKHYAYKIGALSMYYKLKFFIKEKHNPK